MGARGSNLSQGGVGLIEVLITLVVISIGLLGMASLQARAQLAEMESYQRVQALILLDDMAGRMNANRPYRDCYDLSAAGLSYLGNDVDFLGAGCNVRADKDLAKWDALLDGAAESLNEGNVGAMVGARGCIVRLAPNLFEISVAWQGLSPTAANANNACAQGLGLYGDDDARRRVVSRTVRYANLL